MVNLILFLFSFLKFTWFCLILFCLICFCQISSAHQYFKIIIYISTWLNYFGFVWFYLDLLFLLNFSLFYTHPLKSSHYCYIQFTWYLYIYWFLTISFLVLFGSSLFLVSKILLLVDLKLHPLQKFLFIKLGKYTHTFFVWTVHSALNIEK